MATNEQITFANNKRKILQNNPHFDNPNHLHIITEHKSLTMSGSDSEISCENDWNVLNVRAKKRSKRGASWTFYDIRIEER